MKYDMKLQKYIFFQIWGRKKFAFTIWKMLEKLTRTRSKLGPKIRAEARTRSNSGFQYSYSLGARDFDARPIPSRYSCFTNMLIFSAPNFILPEKWSQTYMVTRSCNLRTSVNLVQNYHCGISPLYINCDSQLCYHQKNTQFKAISKTLLKGKYYKYHIDTNTKPVFFFRERVLKWRYIGNLWCSNQIFAQKVDFGV